MISLVFNFGVEPTLLPAEDHIKTKFVDMVLGVAKKSDYFREITSDDIIVYKQKISEIEPLSPKISKEEEEEKKYSEIYKPKKIQNQKRVELIELKILQIETEEDVESFLDNFLLPLKEFYKNLEISSKKLSAFVTFDSDRLGRLVSGEYTGPDITCMEKKKEKLQKRG